MTLDQSTPDAKPVIAKLEAVFEPLEELPTLVKADEDKKDPKLLVGEMLVDMLGSI
jgi:hypothetical protein